MSRIRYSVEPGPIWAGWRHLESIVDGLESDAMREASIDAQSLGDEAGRVIAYVQAKAPGLLDVSADAVRGAPPPELSVLLDGIREQVPPNRSFALRRRFLEVIDAGNRAGRFTLKIPYLPAPAPPPPPSPFLHEHFEAMCGQQGLVDAFNGSLEDTSALTPEAWWGRVMFSAIFYGALVKPRWLLAIPDALGASGAPDEADAEAAASRREALDEPLRWLWLEPRAESSKARRGAPRRWFPDPLSRLLLVRGRADGLPKFPERGSALHRRVMAPLRAYAQARGFEALLPSGIRAILRPAVTRLSLYAPGWLVAYADERLPGASLPPAAWQRLIEPPTTIKVSLAKPEKPRVGSGPIEFDDGIDPDESEEMSEEDHSAEWPWQLRDLARIVLAGDDNLKENIAHWHEAQAERLLPSIARVAQWIERRLLTPGRARRELRYRTIYQMLNGGAGRVVGLLANRDPALLDDALEYVELYETALEDAPTLGVRRKVARALRSFHAFLMEEHSAPELEPSTFVVTGKGRAEVDANVVAVDTFFRALNWLRMNATVRHGEEVAKQLGFIASLGFFAGLRRSEAIGVLAGDIDLLGDEMLYLAVRPNKLRKIKTKAGHRTIPLHLLMAPEERKALAKRRNDRARQWNGLDNPLFPDFIKHGKVNDKDPRLQMIAEALQRVTGDPTMRYHHLRHSFASWQALKFCVAEYGADFLPDWFLPTEHDRRRWKAAVHERREVLGRAPSNRRSLLQVSALMGHSGLDVTMDSYIHFADFVLGRLIRRMSPSLDRSTLIALSGYSDTRIREIAAGLGDEDAAGVLDRLADRVVLGRRHAKPTETTQTVAFGVAPQTEAPTDPFGALLDKVGTLLKARWGDKSLEAAARAASVPAPEFKAARERLRALPEGIARRSDDGSADAKSDLPPPRWPGQVALSKRTFETLWRLYREGEPGVAGVQATRRKLVAVVSDLCECWERGSALAFVTASAPQAKRWIWLLGQMGLGEGLRVEHFASGEGAGPSAKRQIDYWSKLLDVAVKRGRSAPERSSATRGSVRIRVSIELMEEVTGFGRADLMMWVRLTIITMAVFDEVGLAAGLPEPKPRVQAPAAMF